MNLIVIPLESLVIATYYLVGFDQTLRSDVPNNVGQLVIVQGMQSKHTSLPLVMGSWPL